MKSKYKLSDYDLLQEQEDKNPQQQLPTPTINKKLEVPKELNLSFQDRMFKKLNEDIDDFELNEDGSAAAELERAAQKTNEAYMSRGALYRQRYYGRY